MEEKVKSFLDEGFDFIEESYSEVPLEFTEVDKDIIVESKDDGKPRNFHILGVCKGVFQPINEPSRNFRVYESDHWQYQISKPDVQERLHNRQMLGQIGHRDARVDDLTISRGEVSHVVTCMEVREDANGKPYLYGELEILDTPAGRILKGLYEGGVGLYISSRGAGKLEDMPNYPLVEGRKMRKVSKTSYFLETWDIVKAPGYLKARPVYESASLKEQNSVSEGVQTPLLQQPQLNETIAKEQPKQEQSNEEIQLLKSQIDKLAKIVEKVVDDVYEQPEVEQSVEEQLGDLLNNSSVTDEAYEDVVAILQNAKPELLNKIMENSRGRFNDEHAEKSGLKIDYYRFGGNKPYKIVPKDKSYFETSWDSPRYRTLKQAQKHVLDSYNKPKETNESLAEAVSLLVDSNISKVVLEDIVDTLLKFKN